MKAERSVWSCLPMEGSIDGPEEGFYEFCAGFYPG